MIQSLSRASLPDKALKSAVASSATPIGSQPLHRAWNETAPLSPIGAQLGAVNELALEEDWTRITPHGVYPNPAGLQIVDQESCEAMVGAFNSLASRVQRLFRGLPYYEGHPDHPDWARTHPGVRAVAVGRIKALEARADGLWGKVAWNEQGKALVSGEAPAYEGHSPHWAMTPILYKGKKAFRPVELRSVGLTNTPNIPGNLLGANDAPAETLSPIMRDLIIKLLTALGTAPAPDATDEQLSAAIEGAIPAATAARSATEEAADQKSKAASAANEAAAAKASFTAERAARIDLVLQGAINEGRLTTAQRPEWEQRLVKAADLATELGALSALKPAINTSPLVGSIGTRRGQVNMSTDRIAAINTELAAYKTAHPGVSHDDAWRALKSSNPTLFA